MARASKYHIAAGVHGHQKAIWPLIPGVRCQIGKYPGEWPIVTSGGSRRPEVSVVSLRPTASRGVTSETVDNAHLSAGVRDNGVELPGHDGAQNRPLCASRMAACQRSQRVPRRVSLTTSMLIAGTGAPASLIPGRGDGGVRAALT